MKVLRNLLIVVLVILAGVLGASFLLPPNFAAEGTDVVPGDAGPVYAKFATPRTWARWSAWTTRRDPTLVYTYAGPDSGVGAIMRWTSHAMGNGQLEIVGAVPGREVRYELGMTGSSMAVHGHVGFEPVPGGTRVTWRDTGTMGGNPLGRYLHPLLGRGLRAAYRESFANLRREAQGR